VAKYLFEVHYTAHGAKSIAHEGGSGRHKTMVELTEHLGGKLESYYYAFGEVDLYAIVDLPDAITAAAIALAVNQGGGATVKTVVLIAPEDMDKAGKMTAVIGHPGAEIDP
jgi:uncharacterized protein with GYD domain